jgi:hypothetical protein
MLSIDLFVAIVAEEINNAVGLGVNGLIGHRVGHGIKLPRNMYECRHDRKPGELGLGCVLEVLERRVVDLHTDIMSESEKGGWACAGTAMFWVWGPLPQP